MSGGRDLQKKQMLMQAIESLKRHLLARPKDHPELLYLANLNDGIQTPVMEELVYRKSLRFD